MKLAIAGTGVIAGAHAAAAGELGWPVVAAASRTPAEAAAKVAPWGARAVAYADLPGGADAVIVTTPPWRHAHDAIAAIDGGARAILVEKPLATTLGDAEQLVAAAAGAGARVVYGENLAFSPAVRELAAIAATMPGCHLLEVRAMQGRPGWGGFLTAEWGGGALFDLGVHPLAIALLVARAAGAGELRSVQASLDGAPDHPTDEHAEVTLTFASGLAARVVSSWRGGPAPAWDAQLASADHVARLEVFPSPALEHDGDPVALANPSSRLAMLHQLGFVAQLQALGAPAAPDSDLGFGVDVLRVVLAAYHSAGSGTTVDLPWEPPRDRTPLQLWRP